MATRIFPISTGKASWGDTVTPTWTVQKQESAGGFVRAIVEHDLPKYEYTIKFPALTKSERDILLGFFNTCKGQLLPFFIKNYMDCHVEKQQLGMGTDGKYQLVKNNGGYVEPVYHADNIKVYVNGAETNQFSYADGKITVSASGTVTASYDYYEKVRFAGNVSFNETFIDVWNCSVKVVSAR